MARRHRTAVQNKRPPREDVAHDSFSPFLEGVLLFLIVAVFAALRLRLLDLPLERDEGEYAYAGQLLLQGIPPYALLSPLPWLIAAAGLGLLISIREMRPRARFVIAFSIASLAAVIPGLYFRPHYFIVLFPAIALLNAAAVAGGARVLAGRAMQAVPATLFALALVFSIGMRWNFLAEMNPDQLNRRIYSASPFAEAVTIGDCIREHTSPSDRIAVIGSEPEIYFYAQRRSATGYIYTYPLMEKQAYASKMQREMIAEVERANPRYLVMIGVGESWREQPGSDRTIFDWSERVVNHSYTLDGVADMLPDGTRWVWGPEAARYEPRAQSVLMVFRRRG